MIEKNVIILADSEEQMQGIIRGIEALDTNRQIGIIMGTHAQEDSQCANEIIGVLADVADATVIYTSEMSKPSHPTDTPIKTMQLSIPDSDREKIIDYIETEYPNIIKDLLSP